MRSGGLGWDLVYFFSRNIHVLVNGIIIQDIRIKRGLKKGDPLTSFIFLLVAEGLHGLIYRVMELGIYFGFRVRSFNLMVYYLLYTYDTLILVIPTIDFFLILRSSLGVLSSLQIFKSIFLRACSLGLMLTCFFFWNMWVILFILGFNISHLGKLVFLWRPILNLKLLGTL